MKISFRWNRNGWTTYIMLNDSYAAQNNNTALDLNLLHIAFLLFSFCHPILKLWLYPPRHNWAIFKKGKHINQWHRICLLFTSNKHNTQTINSNSFPMVFLSTTNMLDLFTLSLPVYFFESIWKETQVSSFICSIQWI